MSNKLLIRDLTLRDGQQSSFATRMKQEQVDRVLPFYKDANFYAMEVWGGAVPDSVMRYLNENPWNRLQTIHKSIGNASKLTALSRGRNLFGYTPYNDEIINGFCKNAISSGLGIMRIFDALNDRNNVKSTIKYVKEHGGIADCAVCYTIDDKKTENNPVFTDEYFVEKAKKLEELGADMITIKDMSGLIPPSRVYKMVTDFKNNLSVPVDFHTHCTPGYGLASVLSSIVAGVDIVDTNIWYFAGGPAAPAIELIYIFTNKLGIEMDVNMEAVAKINKELYTIRKELAEVDAIKKFPNPFNPLTDKIPANIDAEFDKAIEAAKANNEEDLMKACRAIEDYFGFPPPNEMVKKAQIPGGMYTNMVAQLKALKSEDILEEAMNLIPQVRYDAGLVPLVTPTSQIVGAQAVNCALDMKKGKPMYTNVSNQFISLVKGEYGETPININPDFREKLCGHREPKDFDTSNYKMQDNPILEDCGGVKLAENEEEILLLELFPMVARGYLKGVKKAAYDATNASSAAQGSGLKKADKSLATGKKITVPMPGKVLEIKVKPGDKVAKGQTIIVLEAMKMENSITSDYEGYINNLYVEEGESVPADSLITDIISEQNGLKTSIQKEEEKQKENTNSEIDSKKITVPMPGKIMEYTVKPGDKVSKGQTVAVLEAMKMENSIVSDYDGFIYKLNANEGDTVAADACIVEITKEKIESNIEKNTTVSSNSSSSSSSSTKSITVPMPGKILDIKVKPGDTITKGQSVIILEAMKMENTITSDYEGVVAEVFVNIGDTVAGDDKVISILDK